MTDAFDVLSADHNEVKQLLAELQASRIVQPEPPKPSWTRAGRSLRS